MRSYRPYLLTLFLCQCFIHIIGETELTDLIAEESGIQTKLPAIHFESKDDGDQIDMAKLIQPTIASDTGLSEEKTSSASGHGKPTMTVTAIRLGTSRYFHPGSFDSTHEEHPHSVITAESPTKAPVVEDIDETVVSTPELQPTHHQSFDFEHESPMGSGSFEYNLDQELPTPSQPFLGILSESQEKVNSQPPKSEETSSEGSEQHSAENKAGDRPGNVSEIDTPVPTLVLDVWPSAILNLTDNQNVFELPDKSLSTKVSPSTAALQKEEIMIVGDELENPEDELNDEEGNELPEVLPNPVPLISSADDSNKKDELQEEFAEALRKVEPKPRQRRPGPGTRRRVRMRVKKLGSNSKPNLLSQPSTTFGAVSQPYSEPDATKAPRRFRSTTTTPIPDPSPPTVPYTKFETTTFIPKENPRTFKNSNFPIVLKTGNLSKKELEVEKVILEPQIEKPTNVAFTEKSNAFFFPSTIPNSMARTQSTKPVPDAGNPSKDSNDEWMQSANSKHHDVHHPEVSYYQERDNWENNYMNLQQNSFYGASAETVEHPTGGQTLVDLNRKNENHRVDGGVHVSEAHQSSPTPTGPSNLVSHSINAQENQPQPTLAFSPPKIVYVEQRAVANSQNTESPEMPILQRPPESQFPETATGSEDTQNHQYVSHLARPLVPFHSQEDYSALDHPDLIGPTSGSDPQYENPSRISHYDRTKYEFIDTPVPVEYQTNSVALSTEKPLTIIVADDPPPQEVYTHYKLSDEDTHPERPPQLPPKQVSSAPFNPSRPFNSQEFLGFGNENHLVPEHIHPPSNRLKKSQDFDIPTKGLQKDSSSFNSVQAFNELSNNKHHANSQRFPFHSEPYSKHEDPQNMDQSFIPFPRGYGGGVKEVPPPRPDSLDSRRLQSQYMAGLIQQHPSPSTSYQHSPHKNNRGAPDTFKSSDFSNSFPAGNYHPQKLRGVSPTITLPMPGLVSVPTPPPDGMHEVTPNRHFPPHTHSMAANPDYEPANPPLPNGHPMQHHFDPFIQNAGDFPNEPSTKSKNNPNSNFKNFNGPTQGSFSGQSGAPFYTYPQSPPSSKKQRPAYDILDLKAHLDASRKKQPNKNFPPKPYLDETEHHDEDKGNNFDGTSIPAYETAPENDEGNTPDYSPSLNDFSPTGLSNFLEHEGSSMESSKDPQQPKPTQSSPYSDVPYVLMFSNLSPDSSPIPTPPILKSEKYKPSDPSVLAMGSEMQNSMGLAPGYHAVPVHPRDQMLRVLATNHYNNLLEEMEKKKKPPSSIYTPYGVLVPAGPTASSSSISQEGHPHSHHHQSGHGHGFNFNIKSPLITAHKHFGHDKGRITANVGLKTTVEPALEILAHKVALKLSALESLLRHPTKQMRFHHHHGGGSGGGVDSTHSEAPKHPQTHAQYPHPNTQQHGQHEHTNLQNPHTQDPHQGHYYHNQLEGSEGSYSEQKPTQVVPSESPKKGLKSSSPLKSKSGLPNSDKEQSSKFKLYIKELLKERLYEMLNEMDESGSEVKAHKIPPPFHQGPAKPWPIPEPDKHKFQKPPNLIPINYPKKASDSGGGILQSIKRFFTFGRQTQPVGHDPSIVLNANHIRSFNFSGKYPGPPLQDHIESAANKPMNRFQKKIPPGRKGVEGETTNDRLSAKDIEKILSILLKSDTRNFIGWSERTGAERKSDNLESSSQEKPGVLFPSSLAQKLRKFTVEDAFEPKTSESSHRPMGIRMVVPPRLNVLNRRNFINSKIDKGHWRMPRSFEGPSPVPHSKKIKAPSLK